MTLYNHLKGDASTPKAPHTDQSWSAESPGPYIGIVKGNTDPTRMGRLRVLIPSLAGTTDITWSQLITCEYLSPFYGAKSISHNVASSTSYNASQHSYGFWAIPPDLDTKVLVIFAEGKIENAYWIGCIQDPFTNHMVPGIASSTNTFDKTTGLDVNNPNEMKNAGVDKVATYGSTNVPAGELNRAAVGALKGTYESLAKPIHPFAEVLLKQGLSTDDIRGNTSSSARRESPSQVFGISTPGRKNKGTTPKEVGVKLSSAKDFVDRMPGHTFTMDDGDETGLNQLTRLRTASGHQLLMHDTDGIVYIANGSGNAWIEMNREGRIDVYSGVGGINLRTEGDFNLHSDANVNIHAGNSIRMSAGGEIINSAKMLLNLGSHGVLTSSTNGAIRDFANQGISSYTGGQQLHGAAGGTHLAGGQIHFNSIGASNSWGPHWMNTGAVGMTERVEGDVDITRKSFAPLEPFTRETKTTVHRFVTHEPMPRFSGFTSVGNRLWSNNPNESKAAERLMKIPGTAEFIEQRNRGSKIEAIRLGQYQSDLEMYLKAKMGSSTDSIKARKLALDFANGYDKTYSIVNQVNSISSKIKNLSVGSTVKQIKNNFQTTLTNQVIESVTGGSLELFKDKVFVNQSGKLFSLGNISTVSGITGNLSIENLGSTLTNVSSVTNIYKNVMAGNITGVTQISSLAQKFGLMRPSSLPANLGWAPTYLTKFANIKASIGGWANKGIGAISSFFSDARLKTDIQLVGKSPAGTNIYSFKYKYLDGTYQGVMAQEVPWASELADNGYYMVDYTKLDVEFRRLN